MGGAVSDYTLEPPDESAQVPIKTLIRKLEGSGANAVSPKGARGRFQIEPSTARALGYDPDRLSDPKYAETVMHAAVADLASRYPNDPDAIIVGYNASPKVLNRWISSGRDPAALPPETRHYLARAQRIQSAGQQYTLEAPSPAPKPKAQPAKAAPPTTPQRESVAQAVAKPFKDLPGEFAKDYQTRTRQAGNALLSDIQHPQYAAPMGAAGPLVSDALGVVAAPFMAAGDTLLGRPVSRATGGRVSPQQVTDAASIAAPAVGEIGEANALRSAAREAGVARETLEANRTAAGSLPKARPQTPQNTLRGEPEYVARVKRLANMGVDLTPGSIKGGEAKIAEQQSTSGRYQGQAIREAQQRSLQSYNRAGYNEALAPIGEKYPANAPIGRDGVDAVASRIGAVYDRVLPQARLVADKQTAERISEIREDHEELLGPYKGAFDGILKTRVLSRLGPDKAMDGRTFKEVESELTMLSKKYHMSNDGAQHLLGDAIDELNTALRDNMERNSPPHVRPQLKAANTAWAAYKRLEAASERRPSSLGVFTPGDLQQAVKARNRGGSFARGNAMMGQFADDGQAVIGNITPDSGTAGRLNRTRAGVAGAVVGDLAGHAVGGPVGGAIGAGAGAIADRAVGSVTNTLATHMLRRQSNRLLGRSDLTPHNYLKAAEQRTLRRTLPVAGTNALLPPPQQ